MSRAIVWLRQDLRIMDNPALFEACKRHESILPLFILDHKQNNYGQAQVWWLHHSLIALNASFERHLGISLILKRGNPLEIILKLAKDLSIDAVYWNRCYDPESIARDTAIKSKIRELNIGVQSFQANVFHEPWTIYNKTGEYFKIFTPYWKTCLQNLEIPSEKSIQSKPIPLLTESDSLTAWKLLPHLNWASQFPHYWTPGEMGAQAKLNYFIHNHLENYSINRNFPAKNASSLLSPHLHFGEISPWAIVRAIRQTPGSLHHNIRDIEHYLTELGWREFSYYLLFHYPALPYKNFKSAFDTFPWHNDHSDLKRWQQGMTGYPIVDAGMRELWATGYMHNRVRMITASFLTKNLFIDWRIGAAWFFDTLLDADLANNSASWQWVAGSGADAAPYFRIFNPVLQSQKYDPDGHYIRQWVPELTTLSNKNIHAPWITHNVTRIYSKTTYPTPIVNHTTTRKQALAYYQCIKKQEA